MFEFKLTLEEANMVLGALGKQPFEVVAKLINNIQAQAQPQLERVQKEVEAAKAAAADEEKQAA